jgi:hypothetical protein
MESQAEMTWPVPEEVREILSATKRYDNKSGQSSASQAQQYLPTVAVLWRA